MSGNDDRLYVVSLRLPTDFFAQYPDPEILTLLSKLLDTSHPQTALLLIDNLFYSLTNMLTPYCAVPIRAVSFSEHGVFYSINVAVVDRSVYEPYKLLRFLVDGLPINIATVLLEQAPSIFDRLSAFSDVIFDINNFPDRDVVFADQPIFRVDRKEIFLGSLIFHAKHSVFELEEMQRILEEEKNPKYNYFIKEVKNRLKRLKTESTIKKPRLIK